MTALVIGGCTSAPPPVRPVAVALNQMAAHQRNLLGNGGSLSWPLSAVPGSLNVYSADGGRPANATVNDQVLRALLPYAYDTDAAGSPVWNRDYLAAAPVVDIRSDKVVVTYRLNPRGTWSDGAALNWADLYYQWKACNGSNPAFTTSAPGGYDQITDVARGRDDREAVVTFGRPYADWRALFGPLYPAATTRDPTAFNTGWRERTGPTAGPFKFGSIDRAAGTLTLVRDDGWWGDRAKLDQIVYRVVSETGLVDSYLTGGVDFVEAGMDADRYRRARTASTGEARRAAGTTFRTITFNGTRPALSDVRVRQALARAIDRAAIARAVLDPLGVAAEPLNNHVMLTGQDGYRDNSGNIGRYDRTAAARLLDEAGWRLEGGVRRKDGGPLELTMVVPAGVAISQREADLVQAMLARVGVAVKISTVPAGEFFEKHVHTGDFDLTAFSWTGGTLSTSSNQLIYAQPTRDPTGVLEIRQNYARVGSPQLDGLLLRATRELDRTKSVALANEIDTAIWQEVHSLPLYQMPNLVMTRRTLANFGARGLASLRYQDIGWIQS